MHDVRRQFGNDSEAEAADYLCTNGYKILEKQWKCEYGEIDLIAEKSGEIVFVEVKARKSETYGFPEDSVTEQKIRHLISCAHAYLDRIGENVSWRIDVIAIEFLQDKTSILHFEAIDIPDKFC